MSKIASLYVGPYALWAGEGGFPVDPAGNSLCTRVLGDHAGPDGTAEVVFGEGPVPAVLYAPLAGRPRQRGPQQTAQYTEGPPGGCAGLDLGTIDRDAEVAAFRRAYARELAAMAKA